VSEWKPIETAPKDGTWFLGLYPLTQEYQERIAVTNWDDTACDGPRFSDVGDWFFSHPTHWMPLPLPPEAGD